jgi:NAD+ diphosphatase
MIEDIMVFAGSPMHRASNERRDETWVAQARANPDGCYLPLVDLKFPVTTSGSAQLFWGDSSWLEKAGASVEPVLLGVLNERPHFAFDASAVSDPEAAFDLTGVAQFGGLREVVPTLSQAEAGITSQARSLLDWHKRHPFCAACGAPTASRNGGSSRHCESCDTSHFARVDPVSIVVVTHGTRCLLGRSGRFRGRMYSALAGFIEPGESLEEATRREVLEESGIEVGAVQYVSSQPWPFPSSLMIGCMAEGLSEEITVDEEELADVQWFERDFIKSVFEGHSRDISLPQPLAIARHLITKWAYEI